MFKKTFFDYNGTMEPIVLALKINFIVTNWVEFQVGERTITEIIIMVVSHGTLMLQTLNMKFKIVT